MHEPPFIHGSANFYSTQKQCVAVHSFDALSKQSTVDHGIRLHKRTENIQQAKNDEIVVSENSFTQSSAEIKSKNSGFIPSQHGRKYDSPSAVTFPSLTDHNQVIFGS